MENQHRKIKGYRELNEQEIAMMNEIKQKGVELGELIDKLYSMGVSVSPTAPSGVDLKWVNIGSDHLQQGLMALTRAVAKPDFF